MTIPIVTSGGWATVLGHIFGRIDDVVATKGSAGGTRVTGLAAQLAGVAQMETDFAASPAKQSVLDGVYSSLNSYQGAQSGWLNYLKTLAGNTLIYMAASDLGQITMTLQQAIATVISQAKTSADSVNQSVLTVGAQTNVGSPTGTPTIVVSTKDQNGLITEWALAETLTFTVTGDSQGTATANQEPVSIAGQPAVSDSFSHLWPGGSGATLSVQVADSTLNNSGGNLLTNSDFETFTTTNYPDNWTIATGAVTTNVLSGGSGNAFGGSGNCLEFLGDVGGTLTAVTQQFGTTPSTVTAAGGTLAKLTPLTKYAFNCWLKGGDVLAAGVLEIALVDGSGTILTDAQGNNCSATKTLTMGTSYVNFNGSFSTPASLPSTVKLRVRLSTALASTKILYIDHLCFKPMTQIYSAGPWVAIFSGATKPVKGDTWTIAIGNTMGKFQKKFLQCFGPTMIPAGLMLPSNVGPTISDALIL